MHARIRSSSGTCSRAARFARVESGNWRRAWGCRAGGPPGQRERGREEPPYGDQRRLEIALASRPTLLLLDEPTAGMTQGEAVRLMALLRRLVGELRLPSSSSSTTCAW